MRRGLSLSLPFLAVSLLLYPLQSVLAEDISHSIDLERSSSQLLSITDASQAGLDTGGLLTVEAWFKLEEVPVDNSTERNTLVFKGYSSGGYLLQIGASGFHGQMNNTSHTVNVNWPGIEADVWHHVAWVMAGSGETGSTIYLDGSQLGQDNGVSSITDSSNDFIIGATDQGLGPIKYFDGLLDDVRIWNVARTSQQISDNRSLELQGNESGLVGYWKFTNDTLDQTANHNNLTLNGSPTYSEGAPVSPAYSSVPQISTDTPISPATQSAPPVVASEPEPAPAPLVATSAKFVIPRQNLSFSIPGDGQIFRGQDTNHIYARVGNAIWSFDMNLAVGGNKNIVARDVPYRGAIDYFADTGQEANHENRQVRWIKEFESKGIFIEQLPVYNMADVYTAFVDISAPKPFEIQSITDSALIFSVKPTLPGGEVITKTVSPQNPQGADIVSSTQGMLVEAKPLDQVLADAGGTPEQILQAMDQANQPTFVTPGGAIITPAGEVVQPAPVVQSPTLTSVYIPAASSTPSGGATAGSDSQINSGPFGAPVTGQPLGSVIDYTINGSTSVTSQPITPELLAFAKTVGNVGKEIVVQTIQDAKVCITEGGVQQCLSTCGVALDATGVGAPVAMACDVTNGIIYFVNGETIQAGASMVAVVPFVGSFAKGAIKLTTSAAEDAAFQATRAAAVRLARVEALKLKLQSFGFQPALALTLSDTQLPLLEKMVGKVKVSGVGVKFASGALLKKHFDDHAKEFLSLGMEIKNKQQFLSEAKKFLSRSDLKKMVYTHVNPKTGAVLGDRVGYYDSVRNIFAATDDAGNFNTFFLPEAGAEYFKTGAFRDIFWLN
ncbi:MAG: LamG-like jellyroll fold domain-containing protein [bacterium]|nr:LamG-like jellyroll fold domain-containing protein [bacterium]